MAELAEYSNIQSETMQDIVNNDNGFHNTFMVADNPLYEMLQENEKGLTFTQGSATVSLTFGSSALTLNVRHSNEQKCWFFSVSFGNDKYNGIVHFNTIYNPKGKMSFAFLSDSNSDDIESVTRLLPYINFFVMRK